MNGDIRSFVRVLYTLRYEDGDTDEFVRREIMMATRWHAPAFDKIEGRKGPENPPGMRTLHDLDQGNAVTAERLQATVRMLLDARAYYESNPPEPYEGRNEEAAADMTTLAATIATAIGRRTRNTNPEEATR